MNRAAIWESYGGSGIPTALQLFREIDKRCKYDAQYFSLAGWMDLSLRAFQPLSAFASDNDVLDASITVIDIVTNVEKFRPTFLNVAFWDASFTPE